MVEEAVPEVGATRGSFEVPGGIARLQTGKLVHMHRPQRRSMCTSLKVAHDLQRCVVQAVPPHMNYPWTACMFDRSDSVWQPRSNAPPILRNNGCGLVDIVGRRRAGAQPQQKRQNPYLCSIGDASE